MLTPNPLQPGQKIGLARFTLIRQLGQGGMGVVWLAQDEKLGESVALKFLPPEVRADPGALDDLRRETLRSRKLSHPHIVRIHDFHDAEGEAPFISMEYVDGPNLVGLRVQQAERVLTWELLRPLVRQLCAALDYAHTEGVIHRDLKPANVMLDRKGRLKLADFGIAAVMSESVSRVSVQKTSGTLAYMSPQQLVGKRPTVADDIYALGATLYELLTSKPPFHTGDLTHQILHVANERPEERLAALGIANPIPADVAALIMACLAKEPGQRPQSAQAVAAWIGLELDSQPVAENEGPFQASPNRKRLWAGVALAVFGILGLVVWYGAIHGRRTRLTPVQTTSLREQRETSLASWTERLKQAGLQGKLVQDPDGNLELTMTAGGITNLAPLAGMPLSSLRLSGVNCLFTNLSPLRGMPLKTLDLANAPVSDLRPLAGMPLQEFDVQGAKNLADLSPLRGMQLRYLSLADTAVKDLTPLEGMPLVVVNLSRTKVSLDLSPITNAPIRALRLDTTPFTNVAQIAALQIDDLNLIDTPVADLSALSRLRLIYLSLDETRVVDLRPLEFMPLERLGLAGTPIKDISVLRGKHLKVLYLARCAQLRDLSPLGDCRDLEELSLPLNHGDIEFLRQLPRLKNLGYDSPPPPAADFWREYDARKNVPK